MQGMLGYRNHPLTTSHRSSLESSKVWLSVDLFWEEGCRVRGLDRFCNSKLAAHCMAVRACRAVKTGSMANPLPHKLICHGCLQQSASYIHEHEDHLHLRGSHGGNSSGARGMRVLHVHQGAAD